MEILTSKDLLKQQLAEITEQQAEKSKPIELPKSVGISYNAELQRMINLIRVDIEKSITPQLRELAPEYTADTWVDVVTASLSALRARWSGERFQQFAERVASNFVQAVNLQNQQQFAKQFKSFGINVFSANATVSDYLQASVADNVRLIKSIPEQYLTQVESIVLTNMRSGLRPSAIQEQLIDQFGLTKNRAKLIAADQSSKVSNDLARKRMRSAGIKYFQWVTSKDERVRHEHTMLANKVTMYGKGIYSFEDLPLDKKGQPVAPGIPIRCRCIQRPVLESEVVANQKSGRVVKGVRR